VDLVLEELSANTSVDRDVVNKGNLGAAVDTAQIDGTEYIRSYDLSLMKAYETRYETMYSLHGVMWDSERRQLGFAREVIALIDAEDSN
jgi:hypothetical protein